MRCQGKKENKFLIFCCQARTTTNNKKELNKWSQLMKVQQQFQLLLLLKI
jgi:hypothetical protein